MKKILLFFAFITVGTFSNGQKAIDKTSLINAGVAAVDITPDHPVMLTGYSDRQTVFDSVVQHLKAKALFLGSDPKSAVVIITLDLIGFPASMADELSSRLSAKIGLQRSQLAVTATHTHAGPETGVLVSISGKPVPAPRLYEIKKYRDELVNQLEQLVLKAKANQEPCQVKWGKGTAGFSINRRVLVDKKWTNFGTTGGPVEHDLPVMQVVNSKGETKGILLNYACHGTTLTGTNNFVHGDWMGQAQQLLEERYNGAVAMVVIGCGADSNPAPRGELKYVLEHGKTIADEVQRLIESKTLAPIRQLPATSFVKIKLDFDHMPHPDSLLKRSALPAAPGMTARSYLEVLARGETIPVDYDYPVQVWNFGQDLTMVFLGGEVVVDYVKRMKQELGAEKLWMNAYSNDVSCYIASRRLFDEGGYEVDGSMDYYNKPSRFKSDTEDRIVKAIKKGNLQTMGSVHK